MMRNRHIPRRLIAAPRWQDQPQQGAMTRQIEAQQCSQLQAR
jgi:hypothetical protein